MSAVIERRPFRISVPRPEGPPQGNGLLFHLLGADIRYYPVFDPHGPELWALTHQIEAELQAKGERPYIVHFDLRPGAIIRDLNLRRPIFQQTAAYGHFGRDDLDLSWECTDRAAALRAAAGL